MSNNTLRFFSYDMEKSCVLEPQHSLQAICQKNLEALKYAANRRIANGCVCNTPISKKHVKKQDGYQKRTFGRQINSRNSKFARCLHQIYISFVQYIQLLGKSLVHCYCYLMFGAKILEKVDVLIDNVSQLYKCRHQF